MSLPWFPFWVDDFLASPKVRMMKPEEVGVYVMLLCEQHQNGRVEWPCERKAAALQTHPDCIEYVLAQCFKKDRHGFYSPRLRQIHAEQEARSQQGKKAAEARWGKSSDADASPPHVPDDVPAPMQTDSNQSHSQIHTQTQRPTSPSLSAREAGVRSEPADECDFDELWAVGGKGPLIVAEAAYYRHVPSQISHDDLVKAFTAYKANLDGAHEMNTGNWIAQKGYADTTLFTKASATGTSRDSYFDTEAPE